MPKSTKSSRDDKEKREEKSSKRSSRSERGDSRERKSGSRRDRSRSEERSSKSGDRKSKDRIKRRSTDGEVGSSGNTYSRGIERAGDDALPNSQPGAGGFSQFPGQYDADLPGAPSTRPSGQSHGPAPLSNHVPDMFPGQFPTGTSAPYRPPMGAGLAADYYYDNGESVQHQPGVRPAEPTLIVGAQPHLMAASPIAAPPLEPSATGGTGAAAAFYSGQNFASPSTSPKPNRPAEPTSAVSPHSANGFHFSGAGVGAAAAGAAAAGYMLNEHSSSQHQTSYSSGHGQSSSYPNGSGSKPPRPDVSPRHSSSYFGTAATAAGAAGLAAAAYSHHQQHHNQNNGHYSGGGGGGGGGGYNSSDMMQHRRRRGPMSRFVDFFRDPDGVARYEEYSEYVGVCRYCFEPGSSPRDAPRKHSLRRRSFEKHGSSTRVDKEQRYYTEDSKRRNKDKDRSWVASAATGLGLAAAGKAIFGNNRDFDDTYSVHSGKVGASSSSVNLVRRYSSDDGKGAIRRGKIGLTEADMNKVRIDSFERESKGSRSSKEKKRKSSESKSGLTEGMVGATVAAAAIGSEIVKRSSSPKSGRSGGKIRSSSSERSKKRKPRRSSPRREQSPGFFAGLFGSPPAESRSRSSKKSNGFFSFSNSSSSSVSSRRGRNESDGGRRKKSSRKIKSTDEAKAAVVGLGAAAAALAAVEGRGSSGSRRGRVVAVKESKGKEKEHSRRHDRDHDHASGDDMWEDASEGDVDFGLAYDSDGSQVSLSKASGTNKWDWRWKRSPSPDHRGHGAGIATAATVGLAGAAVGAAIEHRERDKREKRDKTSDDRYYEPGSRKFEAQGPVPIQQPQPFAPVSTSVYGVEDSYDARNYGQHDESSPRYEFKSKRDGYSGSRDEEDRRRYSEPHIVNISPKPRSKSDSVRFNFTEEQERRHQEQESAEVDRFSRKGSDGRDSEKRRRKRRESSDDYSERPERTEPSSREERRSSKGRSWEEEALIGAAGVAVGAAVAGELKHKSDEKKQRRRSEERVEGRKERDSYESRSTEKKSSGWDSVANVAVVSDGTRRLDSSDKYDKDPHEDLSDVDRDILIEKRERTIARRAANLVKRAPSPVHEDYASYFVPDELKYSHSKNRDAEGDSRDEAHIVTIEPKDSSGALKDPPFAGLEKFTDEPTVNLALLNLPWQVPPLRLINPTPPPPLVTEFDTVEAPIQKDLSNDSAEEEVVVVESKAAKKGKVDVEETETPEYEPVAPKEGRGERTKGGKKSKTAKLAKEEAKDVESPAEEIRRDHIPGAFEDDIDFAATIAAGLEKTGFDPDIAINDPQYRRRDSPPGSNGDSFYQQPFYETVSDIGMGRRANEPPSMQHGWVEDQELPATPKDEARSVAFDAEENEKSSGSSRKKDKKDKKKQRSSLNKSTSVDDYEQRDSEKESTMLAADDGDAELDIIEAASRAGSEDEAETAMRGETSRSVDPWTTNGDRDLKSNGTHDYDYSRDDMYESPNDDAASVASAPTAIGEEGRSKKSKKKKRRSIRDDDDTASVVSSPAKIEPTRNGSSSVKKGGIFGIFSKAVDDAADTRRAKEESSERGTEDRKGKSRSDRSDRSDRSRDADEDKDSSRKSKKKEKRRSRQSMDDDEGDRGRSSRDLSSKEQAELDTSELALRTDKPSSSRTRQTEDEEEQPSFLGERPKPAKPPDLTGDRAEDTRGREPPTPERKSSFHSRSGSSQPTFGESPADPAFSTPEQPRRQSMMVSTVSSLSGFSASTPSPTAVPIPFLRRPSAAGGAVRSTSATPLGSPSSATRPRKARPLSTEFNSKEFRPLFLVERHQSKEIVPTEDAYPSLPSSHSNSRSSSVHSDSEGDQPLVADEDFLRDRTDSETTPKSKFKGRALDLSAAKEAGDDLLDSEQVTPTAASFDADRRKKRERHALEQAMKEHVSREAEWNQRHSGEYAQSDAGRSASGEAHSSDGTLRDDLAVAMALGAAALVGGGAAVALGEHHTRHALEESKDAEERGAREGDAELVDEREGGVSRDLSLSSREGHSDEAEHLPAERRLSRGMSPEDAAAAMAAIAAVDHSRDGDERQLVAEHQEPASTGAPAAATEAMLIEDGETPSAYVKQPVDSDRSVSDELNVESVPATERSLDMEPEHKADTERDVPMEDAAAADKAEDMETASVATESAPEGILKRKNSKKNKNKEKRRSVTFDLPDEMPDFTDPEAQPEATENTGALAWTEEPEEISLEAADTELASESGVTMAADDTERELPQESRPPSDGADAHVESIVEEADDDEFKLTNSGSKKNKKKKGKKHGSRGGDEDSWATEPSEDQSETTNEIVGSSAAAVEAEPADDEWGLSSGKKGKGKKNKKNRQASLPEESERSAPAEELEPWVTEPSGDKSETADEVIDPAAAPVEIEPAEEEWGFSSGKKGKGKKNKKNRQASLAEASERATPVDEPEPEATELSADEHETKDVVVDPSSAATEVEPAEEDRGFSDVKKGKSKKNKKNRQASLPEAFERAASVDEPEPEATELFADEHETTDAVVDSSSAVAEVEPTEEEWGFSGGKKGKGKKNKKNRQAPPEDPQTAATAEEPEQAPREFEEQATENDVLDSAKPEDGPEPDTADPEFAEVEWEKPTGKDKKSKKKQRQQERALEESQPDTGIDESSTPPEEHAGDEQTRGAEEAESSEYNNSTEQAGQEPIEVFVDVENIPGYSMMNKKQKKKAKADALAAAAAAAIAGAAGAEKAALSDNAAAPADDESKAELQEAATDKVSTAPASPNSDTMDWFEDASEAKPDTAEETTGADSTDMLTLPANVVEDSVETTWHEDSEEQDPALEGASSEKAEELAASTAFTDDELESKPVEEEPEFETTLTKAQLKKLKKKQKKSRENIDEDHVAEAGTEEASLPIEAASTERSIGIDDDVQIAAEEAPAKIVAETEEPTSGKKKNKKAKKEDKKRRSAGFDDDEPVEEFNDALEELEIPVGDLDDRSADADPAGAIPAEMAPELEADPIEEFALPSRKGSKKKNKKGKKEFVLWEDEPEQVEGANKVETEAEEAFSAPPQEPDADGSEKLADVEPMEDITVEAAREPEADPISDPALPKRKGSKKKKGKNASTTWGDEFEQSAETSAAATETTKAAEVANVPEQDEDAATTDLREGHADADRIEETLADAAPEPEADSSEFSLPSRKGSKKKKGKKAATAWDDEPEQLAEAIKTTAEVKEPTDEDLVPPLEADAGTARFSEQPGDIETIEKSLPETALEPEADPVAEFSILKRKGSKKKKGKKSLPREDEPETPAEARDAVTEDNSSAMDIERDLAEEPATDVPALENVASTATEANKEAGDETSMADTGAPVSEESAARSLDEALTESNLQQEAEPQFEFATPKRKGSKKKKKAQAFDPWESESEKLVQADEKSLQPDSTADVNMGEVHDYISTEGATPFEPNQAASASAFGEDRAISPSQDNGALEAAQQQDEETSLDVVPPKRKGSKKKKKNQNVELWADEPEAQESGHTVTPDVEETVSNETLAEPTGSIEDEQASADVSERALDASVEHTDELVDDPPEIEQHLLQTQNPESEQAEILATDDRLATTERDSASAAEQPAGSEAAAEEGDDDGFRWSTGTSNSKKKKKKERKPSKVQALAGMFENKAEDARKEAFEAQSEAEFRAVDVSPSEAKEKEARGMAVDNDIADGDPWAQTNTVGDLAPGQGQPEDNDTERSVEPEIAEMSKADKKKSKKDKKRKSKQGADFESDPFDDALAMHADTEPAAQAESEQPVPEKSWDEEILEEALAAEQETKKQDRFEAEQALEDEPTAEPEEQLEEMAFTNRKLSKAEKKRQKRLASQDEPVAEATSTATEAFILEDDATVEEPKSIEEETEQWPAKLSKKGKKNKRKSQQGQMQAVDDGSAEATAQDAPTIWNRDGVGSPEASEFGMTGIPGEASPPELPSVEELERQQLEEAAQSESPIDFAEPTENTQPEEEEFEAIPKRSKSKKSKKSKQVESWDQDSSEDRTKDVVLGEPSEAFTAADRYSTDHVSSGVTDEDGENVRGLPVEREAVASHNWTDEMEDAAEDVAVADTPEALAEGSLRTGAGPDKEKAEEEEWGFQSNKKKSKKSKKKGSRADSSFFDTPPPEAAEAEAADNVMGQEAKTAELTGDLEFTEALHDHARHPDSERDLADEDFANANEQPNPAPVATGDQQFELVPDSESVAEEAAWVEAERRALAGLPPTSDEPQTFESVQDQTNWVDPQTGDRAPSPEAVDEEWSSKKKKKKSKKRPQSQKLEEEMPWEQADPEPANLLDERNAAESHTRETSLKDLAEYANQEPVGVRPGGDRGTETYPEDLAEASSTSAHGTTAELATAAASVAGVAALGRSSSGKKGKKDKKKKKYAQFEEEEEEEPRELTEDRFSAHASEHLAEPEGDQTDAGMLRDSAVYIDAADSPPMQRSARDIRDSGYQGSPMTSKYGQLEDDYEQRKQNTHEPGLASPASASGVRGRSRSRSSSRSPGADSFRHPVRQSIEADPAYDIGSSSHGKDLSPVSPRSAGDMELPQTRSREISPVESTTRDRASTTLFSSSPSTREIPRKEYGSSRHFAQTFTPDRGTSEAESMYEAGSKDSESLFGGPSGVNSDENGLGSPPKTPAPFEGTPLPTITEDSPEDQHNSKHNREIGDIGQPDHGVKSRRKSTSSPPPHRHYPHRAHSPLNPEHQSARRLGHISTEDLSSRPSWSAVEDDREVADFDRGKSRGSNRSNALSSPSPDMSRPRRPPSLPLDAIARDRRSVSGDSVRSGDSINAYIRPSPEPPHSGNHLLRRRSERSISSDLREEAKRLSQGSDASLRQDKSELGAKSESARGNEEENIAASSSSYDPTKDKGKSRITKMAGVYEAWGDAQGSPRSPTRPPSMRRRQSLQILDLETRLDQLVSENRLLQDAKSRADRGLDEAQSDHDQKNVALQDALQTRDIYLQQKDEELEHLRETLEGLQHQVSQLTEVNAGLTAAHTARSLDDGYEERYRHLEEEHRTVLEEQEGHTRELEALRNKHVSLSGGMEGIIRQEVSAALASKDAELQAVREELEHAQQQVRSLQQQILHSRGAGDDDNTVVERDEDYFEAQCQKLCQQIQTWVLRFSKYSDTKICRSVKEINDEVIRDRYEDVMLDGSDVDLFLRDRVRRRDVFMAVVMGMVQQYVFMRYLFGMDREQRNKLKALEKHLSEVGSDAAVNRWRATTLALLTRRPAFAQQRQSDIAELVEDIYATLAKVLNPPSDKRPAAREGLVKVVGMAADLSTEMRTQRARYVMLPPLAPEFDADGELARTIPFNASMMNERSGRFTSNEQLQADGAAVRLMLFPLVVQRDGDADADDGEDIIVCPAQVLVANDEDDRRQSRSSGKKAVRVVSAASLGTVATGPTESGMF